MREVCETRDAAIEKFGFTNAKALSLRLAEIWAAKNAVDLPFAEIVVRDSISYLKIAINSELNLWMTSTSKSHLGKPKVEVKLADVDRVKVVGIE
jgi:hypothetical protein